MGLLAGAFSSLKIEDLDWKTPPFVWSNLSVLTRCLRNAAPGRLRSQQNLQHQWSHCVLELLPISKNPNDSKLSLFPVPSQTGATKTNTLSFARLFFSEVDCEKTWLFPSGAGCTAPAHRFSKEDWPNVDREREKKIQFYWLEVQFESLHYSTEGRSSVDLTRDKPHKCFRKAEKSKNKRKKKKRHCTRAGRPAIFLFFFCSEKDTHPSCCRCAAPAGCRWCRWCSRGGSGAGSWSPSACAGSTSGARRGWFSWWRRAGWSCYPARSCRAERAGFSHYTRRDSRRIAEAPTRGCKLTFFQVVAPVLA